MRLSTVAAIAIFITLVADEIGLAFRFKTPRIRRGGRYRLRHKPQKSIHRTRVKHTEHHESHHHTSGKHTVSAGSEPSAAGSPAVSTGSAASQPSAAGSPAVSTGSGRGANVLMGVMLGTEGVSSLAGAGTDIASTVLDNQVAKAEEGEDESDKDKRRNQSNNRRPATQAHRG
uniref:Uncharacterized protein n=1 Tax=Rhipicephalus zambeziensis TaxID=60191 RepID=A0A224YIK2_9ACAR